MCVSPTPKAGGDAYTGLVFTDWLLNAPRLLQMLTLISHLQPQSWSHACSLDILTAFVFILQQLCLQGGEKSASNNNQCISSEFTSYWLLQSNAEIAAVLGRIMLCVVSEQISPLSLLFPWLKCHLSSWPCTLTPIQDCIFLFCCSYITV